MFDFICSMQQRLNVSELTDVLELTLMYSLSQTFRHILKNNNEIGKLYIFYKYGVISQ